MADETYDLPQLIAVALQSQRGKLLKALAPAHATELLQSLNEERLVQILNLIADLIEDRYAQRVQAHEHERKLQQIMISIAELKSAVDNVAALVPAGD